MRRTRPKSLEAGLIMHSRLFRVSLFLMVIKPFVKVSMFFSSYSYFLKPSFGAASLKQCLHKYKLYRRITGPYEPHLTQGLEPLPYFRTFLTCCFPIHSSSVPIRFLLLMFV